MCISDTMRTVSRRTVPLESFRPCRRRSKKRKKISIRNINTFFLLKTHSLSHDRPRSCAVRRHETISSSVRARIVSSRRTRSNRNEITQCSIIVLVSIFPLVIRSPCSSCREIDQPRRRSLPFPGHGTVHRKSRLLYINHSVQYSSWCYC